MLSFTAPNVRIVLSFVIAALIAGVAWNYSPDMVASSAAAGKTAPAVKRGPATIVLQDAREVPAVYDRIRPAGDSRPTTLATTDLDLDGFPDIVSGYATGAGGYIVIQRGNPEAFAPTRPENVQAFNESRYLDSFSAEARLIELSDSPDFIAVGDFNRDNDMDVITARRGGSSLDLVLGNGKGEFSSAGKIGLPGRVTTLAYGQIDQNDTFNDLVVGVEGDGASLLVFEDAKTGVLGSPARHELPAPADSIILAEMDGTMWKDAAILAGGDVLILHGRNQSEGFESSKRAASRLERIDLPFAARAMTLGEFIWDRDGRNELALLRDDGSIAIVSNGELDTRPFSIAEVRDRRRRQNLPIGDPERLAGPSKTWRPDPSRRWRTVEELAALEPAAVNSVGENSTAMLFPAYLSGQAAADIVVADRAARQLKIFAVEAPAKNGDEYVSHAGPRAEMTLATGDAPIAAISMRTSLFVRPGLVFLKEGSTGPEIIPAAPSATFTVDRFDDTAAATACTGGANDCSLRGAHIAANSAAGADVIDVPAGTYTQTIVGNDDGATQGDLDVTQSATISGAGAVTTIIQSGTTNANGIDKTFGFNPLCDPAVSGTVNNVTVRFGNNPYPDGSPNFEHTGGGLDYCGASATTIAITNSTFDQNTVNNSYGGGINLDSLAPSTSNQQITNCAITNNDTVNAADAGGGGVNIFGDQSVVTITGTTISDNRARLTGTDGRGGGVRARITNGGSVTINTSTISNNNASSSGGGIANVPQSGTQSFSMSNSSVTGNTSNGNGAGSRAEGGGFYNNSISSGTVNITESTFTGNTAVAAPVGGVHIGGGGLAFGANNAAGTLSFSRIFGNTATSGSGTRKDNNAGTVTAQNNWWGCSGGPGTTGCQTAVLQGAPAVLTTSPFLQLRTSASLTTVLVGQGSALTASFLLNSAGGAVAASNLDTLIGQTVNWSGVNGSISGAQTTIQAAGTATATYTGTSVGAGSATAQVDGGPASGSLNSVAITVNPASTTTSIISDSPDPSNVGQNVTVSYSVAVTAPGGGTPTGNVQVSDGVNSCTGTVAAGQCTVALNTAGNRTLTATYLGDGNYAASPASAGAGHLVGTVTWTGATNSTFATNTNWNTGLAPGAGDTVIIPAGATNQPTVGSAASVSSLSVASGRILTVNSTLTVSGTLTNNGTIQGTGTIVNNFTNGASGIVAPGLSPGILNITGNYTNAGAYNVEIGGTGGPGVNPNGHDQLLVSGTATVGGTLNVTLTNGFTPTPGNQFVILDAATSSGTFATTNLPNIAPNQWAFGYDNANGRVVLGVVPATAAAASISGRVLTAENSGISRAIVLVTAPDGTVYRATTNSFGYFRVEGLPTGATYTVTVTRKGYQFGQRVITLSQDVVDLDIIAIE